MQTAVPLNMRALDRPKRQEPLNQLTSQRDPLVSQAPYCSHLSFLQPKNNFTIFFIDLSPSFDPGPVDVGFVVDK